MFVSQSLKRCPASTLLRRVVFIVTCFAFSMVSKPGVGQTTDNHVPPARTPDHYELQYRDVQRAILVFKQGEHDAAREILVDAKSKHPEMPPIDVMMARLYFSAGEIQKAQDALERVTVEAPNDPEGFLLMGDLALSGKRSAFAELAYDRAAQNLKHYDASPDRKRNLRIRILAGLASLAENREQYEHAVSFLTSWIELDPTSPVAHGSLGRVTFHLKEYDEARAAFRQLTEIEPKSPPVEIAMGRLFSEAAMHAEAYTEMTTATKRYSDDTRVLLTVGEWALHNGLLELAQKTVTDALELDQESLEGQVLSARLARYTGDYETAETLLSKLMPLHPNSVLLIDEFARTLATSGNEQKRRAALTHAERNYRVLRKKKSSMMLQALITYAWTLQNNGESHKAQAVVQSLPNGSSISNENGYYVASIYADREKTEVAVEMLKSLLAEDRPFPLRGKAEHLLATLTNG